MKTLVLLLLASAGSASSPKVVVDPGVELIGVVQSLSSSTEPPHGFASHDTPLERGAKQRFASLARSEAVRLSSRLPAIFDHTQRGDVMLRLSAPPALEPRLFIPDMLVDKAGGKAYFDAWLQSLRDFAKASDFDAYISQEKKTLAPSVKAFAESMKRRDFAGKIEAYTGLPFDGSYTIALSPRFLPGSMINAVIPQDDGTTIIKSIVGPAAESGTYDFRPDVMPATAWHELAHGVLDVLADVDAGRLARSAGLKDSLHWDCYDVWQQCVKEHVVRAVMLRLVAREEGDEAAEKERLSEGAEKWRFLPQMLERLREFEKSRDKYPTLAAFYPRLVDVFPQEAPEPVPRPEASSQPGPEWIMAAAGPFRTAGQRRRALGYVDKVLAGGEDADLRVEKASLEFLLGNWKASKADSRGASPEALLVKALAEDKLGESAASRADSERGAAACVRSGGSRLACENLYARTAPSRKTSSVVDLRFVVDPRVELLSAVWQSGGSAPRDGAYVAEMRKHFAPFARHPAVARLKALVKKGSPIAPVQLVLGLSAPPELKGPGPASFAAELRDFAVKSRFLDFYAAHADYYKSLEETARAESSSGLDPSAVAAYLRTELKGRYRFILAPALPPEFDANATGSDGADLRMRSDYYRDGKDYFTFDDFASDPAHELTHTMTDPVVLSHADALASYASLQPKDCTDSWTGCVMEHVDIAVTLRVLAKTRGEAEFKARLAQYEKLGFPYLGALCSRLEEYERGKDGFSAFFPRLMSVFGEELESKISAQAAEDMTPAGESRGPRIEFAVDPRVELYSILLMLSKKTNGDSPYAREARARFSRFAKHSAVTGLPADGLRLLFQLSRELEPSESAPGEPFVKEAADFAMKSGFMSFFTAHKVEYEKDSEIAENEALRSLSPRAAADYLGEPFSGRYYFVLAPLLPESEATNFVLTEGASTRYVRVRAAARPGPRFGFDSFGGSPAHELVHTITDSLVPDSDLPPGAPPKGCNDQQGGSWSACMREHIVYAVTLRMLARDLGEPRCSERLAAYEVRGFPFLGAIGEQLKDYESSRGRFPTLRSFSPRLLAVFKTAPGDAAGSTPAPPAAGPARAPSDESCRPLKDRGAADFEAGRDAEASSAFEKALAACPRDVELLLDLGVVRQRQGREAEALKYYDAAVSESVARGAADWEHAAAALSSRASLHAGAGRTELARRDLEQALKIVPGEWKGRPDLARQLKELGR